MLNQDRCRLAALQPGEILPKRREEFGVSATAVLEARIAALEEARSDAMRGIGASLPTTIVACVGFWIVHRLSLRRQAREELFKFCDTTKNQVAEIATEGARMWRLEGTAPEAEELRHSVFGRLHRLGTRLTTLHEWAPSFNLNEKMIAVRKAVTDDPFYDPSRPADHDRAVSVLVACHDLETAIDRSFYNLHGSSFAKPNLVWRRRLGTRRGNVT